MKGALRTSSWIAAFSSWLLLSALTVLVITGARDRARLIRDNDNERILSTLFAGLRNNNNFGAADSGGIDFGAAVVSNSLLADRIAGIALYGGDLRPLYRWGLAPPAFDKALLENGGRSGFGRYTIPDRKGRSVKFVIRFGRPAPTPGEAEPHNRPRHGRTRSRGGREGGQREAPEDRDAAGPFFGFMAGDRYLYIDISHPAYWRTLTVTAVLFPLIEACLLALAFYVRHLYLRNREYRNRIAAQQNLVVLGTAAGTLAHEIKNPLHSIRIQTGILARTLPEGQGEEVRIINQEVDRLSALVYRVNDYLREPAGRRAPLDVCRLLEECALRLCGRPVLRPESIREGTILADEDRLRSVFENIIRNALEAGGDSEEIGASVSWKSGRAADRSLVIRLFDRGGGIDPGDLRRIFDPFFTRKSRGTGIGLSVSRRFVEAAGGALTIENREGGGAVVTMVFPEYRPPNPGPAGEGEEI